MLLHDLLQRSAAEGPDRIAVIDAGGSITYRDLDHRANQVASALRAGGVEPGDRVLLLLANSIDFVASYYGALKAGAVAVPMQPGQHNDRLPHVLADCSPVACIAEASALESHPDITLPASLRLVLVRGRQTTEPPDCWLTAAVRGLAQTIDREPVDPSPVRRIDIDLAAIIYTSGSTGMPRGVMLTHLNLVANTHSIVSYLQLTPTDRVMVVLPFYYIYGLSLLHTHIAVGGSLVLDNRFAFPNAVLAGMQHHAVTGFAGVPSTFAMLLHRSGIAQMRFPTLRYVTQSGGPIPPGRVRDLRRALPNVDFFAMYGATETGPRMAYLDPSELDRRVGSIGRAVPNVELRVVTDAGQTAAPGEVGEIVVRGSNVSPGYWNASEESRAAFTPEGYRTGDLAYADEDGFLYLIGRRKDLLKIMGHRVGSTEIETVLSDHPAVYESAVVPAAHPLMGDAPIAYVAWRADQQATEADVLAFCRRRLPDYKVPVRVEWMPELPKTPAGKIDKPALRARAALLSFDEPGQHRVQAAVRPSAILGSDAPDDASAAFGA